MGIIITKILGHRVYNLFADWIIRIALRHNLSKWLKRLRCNGNTITQFEYKKKFISKLKQSAIAIETDTANVQHYEVPTDFFKTVLGTRLKYSCSYWPVNVKTLDQSEDAMLELYCARAQVEDGHNVMDLGCGWGALGLWICEKYPNCTVTCVSNSQTQSEHIQSQSLRLGYSGRLTTRKSDANVFDTEERFDRIMSIEMFEHMKNYDRLFSRVASWLKPGGLLFTQILCHREFAYNFNVGKGSDTEWMAKNFFSGGTMPSSDLFLYFQNDVVLVDMWKMNGKHYSKTLEAWLAILDNNRGEVARIFEKTYGKGEVDQQVWNWRLFFIYCSVVFGYEDGNEWMVSMHLFRKRLQSQD
ncbi:uncharacterized protein LOC100367749 [Saccoglossus kowalevskii]